MNFIYKNIFVLPNLRPYTKHKKRIIPGIITGRISSFFLLLYYTPNSPNSLCWLDGAPPTKTLYQKLGVLQKVGGSGPPPRSHSGCALGHELSVCRLSVTLLRPTQGAELRGTSAKWRLLLKYVLSLFFYLLLFYMCDDV